MKDRCPACGAMKMPLWNPHGHETARACPACHYVEERYPAEPAEPDPPEAA